MDVVFDDDELLSYNFSIVCVIECHNWFYVKQLEEMWPGPISIAIPSPVPEKDIASLSPRVRMAVVETNGLFPLNYLRNVAINNTITSHYIVIDSGTVLDSSLFQTFQLLPPTVLDPSTAIILPLFFTSSVPVKGCRDDETCVVEFSLHSVIIPRQRKLLPKTKQRIREQVAAKKLQMRRGTHVVVCVCSNLEISLH